VELASYCTKNLLLIFIQVVFKTLTFVHHVKGCPCNCAFPWRW
jgi:hypothetical protein